MKRRLAGFYLVIIILMGFGLLSCFDKSVATDVNSVAPDFSLIDISGTNDKPFNLSDTKGKVVILDFWATWCPPCRMEIPHFQQMYQDHADKGLVIVGVAVDQGGKEAVKPFVEQNGVTYPVLIGDHAVTTLYGGISGIPTTFIIDRQGRIVEKYVGYRDKKVFEDAIEKLL